MSTIYETFFDLLGKMCSSSAGPLAPILQALEEMKKMAQKMEEAGRGIASSVNPTVDMAIADLRVLYHDVGGKARLYVISCKDIASYVCKSGVLEAIRDELKSTETSTLTCFLDDMKDYFSVCKSCLEKFNEIQTQFGKEAQQTSTQWSDEAKEKEKEKKINLYASGGFGIAGVTLGAGGMALGAAAVSTIVCPPIAVALAAGVLVGAATSFGFASAFAIEKGISDEKMKVFVEAAKQAVQFYTALADVEIKIGDMEGNLTAIKTYISGLDGHGGLTGVVERSSSGDRISMWKTTNDLDQLRKNMEETLQMAHNYLATTN